VNDYLSNYDMDGLNDFQGFMHTGLLILGICFYASIDPGEGKSPLGDWYNRIEIVKSL